MSEPSSTAESRTPPPNRLSIGHLLAWLTLTAVEFAVHTNALSGAANRWELFEAIYGSEAAGAMLFLCRLGIVLEWCVLPFFALGLVGLLLWPWRAWKATGSFPRQPGHWLLIAVGAAASVEMLATLFYDTLLYDIEGEVLSSEALLFTMYILRGLIALSPAVVLLIGLRRHAETRMWKTCLGLLSVGLVVRAATDFVTAVDVLRLLIIPQWLTPLGGGTILLALVLTGIACVVDQRRSVPRDLFHGLGVIAAIALVFFRLIQWAIHMAV